ncbi:MAG TPA: hypothetical protein ENK32_09945, partial [Anaerolineae bacterium]|nr:hypothetical protein [Anaerolineae bacterium]
MTRRQGETAVLKLKTRNQFATLLDAVVLRGEDDGRNAIIYTATDQEPIFVSQREFRQHVSAYANSLRQAGIQPRDLVVMAHTQNLESIYAFWGALQIGAIPSMFPTLTEKLDPDIYMQNMAELVRLSDVKAILTNNDFAPTLQTRVDCPVY